MPIFAAITFVKGIEDSVAVLLIVHDNKELMIHVVHNNITHITRSFALVVRILYVTLEELILAIEGDDINTILI